MTGPGVVAAATAAARGGAAAVARLTLGVADAGLRVANARQQVGGRQPIPAKPPIGGPIWTIVVPAALLAVSIWGTWLLYRHFSGEK